jgi:hypothetical protein
MEMTSSEGKLAWGLAVCDLLARLRDYRQTAMMALTESAPRIWKQMPKAEGLQSCTMQFTLSDDSPGLGQPRGLGGWGILPMGRPARAVFFMRHLFADWLRSIQEPPLPFSISHC